MAVVAPSTHTLADGSQIVVRLVEAADAPGLAELYQRASVLAGVPRQIGAPLSESQWRRLLEPAVALIARSVDGTVVGLAQLSVESATADLCVIVDDGHQRLGIGDALTQRLMSAAHDLDHPRVRAVVLPTANWVRDLAQFEDSPPDSLSA